MIKYAAIGDSLTVGVGDGYGGGFVPRYGNLTQQSLKQPVIFDNRRNHLSNQAIEVRSTSLYNPSG